MTSRSRTGAPNRTAASAVLATLAPLLFLAPVAAAVAVSVGRLLGVRYPAIGWTNNIDSDAQAIALGISPFQDPAHGYTGSGYTPLYPFLVSLPDHLYRWTGWSVLLTIAAAVGSAVLVARLARRAPLRPGARWRVLSIVEAAGIGALAWSLVYGIRQNGLFDARNDQLTWVAALGAIVLVPAAARGRRSAQAAVVLLVSAAFWVKQPGIIAGVAVATALTVAVLGKRMPLRDLVAMTVATLLLNGLLIALLAVATDGWSLRWNFDIHLPATRGPGYGVRTLAPRLAPAFVFAVAMGGLALATVRRPIRLRRIADSDDGLLATALVVLAVLGAAMGVYLMRFVAGDDNDALALPWALAALGAIGYRRAAVRSDLRSAAALVCVLLAATTFMSGADWRLRRGDVVPAATYASIPNEVTSFAKTHLVYHPTVPLSFLYGRDGAYPTDVQIREVINRRLTPRHLVDAILQRRFAGIFGAFGADPTERYAHLMPGEQNFYWKLNTIIVDNYRTASGTPSIPPGVVYNSTETIPMRVPRPRSLHPELARCFAPFHFNGFSLRIHLGGGFWCRRPGATLALVGTPAPRSQLVSVDPVSNLRGRLGVKVARAAGTWSIGLQGRWTLRARVSGATGTQLTLAGASVTIPPAVMHRTGGRVWLRFEQASAVPRLEEMPGTPATVRVALPTGGPATLAIWSSAPLGTTLNFSDFRVDG